MYEVIWQRLALRQVKKIKLRDERQEIIEAANLLRNFPNCHNVKALTHHPHGYRLRVGRWRILFDVENAIHLISIEEVKKRDERTY